MPEFSSKQVKALRTIMKKNVVDQRELIEKKVYFTLGQAIQGLSDEEKAAELVGGSEDEIYVWRSSLPDQFYPKNSEGVRMTREIGFHKIGYCKDLPGDRRRSKGVYLHDMWATDPKINWMLKKVAATFIINAKAENCRDMYKFAHKDYQCLTKEI